MGLKHSGEKKPTQPQHSAELFWGCKNLPQTPIKSRVFHTVGLQRRGGGSPLEKGLFLCENPVVRGWEAQLDTAAHSCGLALELQRFSSRLWHVHRRPSKGKHSSLLGEPHPPSATAPSSSLRAPSSPSLLYFFSGFHGKRNNNLKNPPF